MAFVIKYCIKVKTFAQYKMCAKLLLNRLQNKVVGLPIRNLCLTREHQNSAGICHEMGMD